MTGTSRCSYVRPSLGQFLTESNQTHRILTFYDPPGAPTLGLFRSVYFIQTAPVGLFRSISSNRNRILTSVTSRCSGCGMARRLWHHSATTPRTQCAATVKAPCSGAPTTRPLCLYISALLVTQKIARALRRLLVHFCLR